MRSRILSYRLQPTTVVETNTRATFMNSLEIEIIKPLAALKVTSGDFFRRGVGPMTDNTNPSKKQTGELTKRRVEKDLRNSTADYADYAEKLQQLKNHPGDYVHSPGPQHGSNRRFGVMGIFRNRRELDRAESEESGASIVSPMGSHSASKSTFQIST